MQHLIDTLSKGWRAERSLSQMTLGKLISILSGLPKETKIEKLCSPHSYRGYYSDLSFKKESGEQSVGELLSILQNECIDKTFEGYKGGDFTMDEHTPLWIADYGCTGLKIMELKEGEVLSFTTKDDE